MSQVGSIGPANSSTVCLSVSICLQFRTDMLLAAARNNRVDAVRRLIDLNGDVSAASRVSTQPAPHGVLAHENIVATDCIFTRSGVTSTDSRCDVRRFTCEDTCVTVISSMFSSHESVAWSFRVPVDGQLTPLHIMYSSPLIGSCWRDHDHNRNQNRRRPFRGCRTPPRSTCFGQGMKTAD